MKDKQLRKSDIITIVDVAMLVNQFYDKIRQDSRTDTFFQDAVAILVLRSRTPGQSKHPAVPSYKIHSQKELYHQDLKYLPS